MSEIIDRFKTLVKRAKIEEASDIHLCVGHEPIFRITGQLLPLPDEKNFPLKTLKY